MERASTNARTGACNASGACRSVGLPWWLLAPAALMLAWAVPVVAEPAPNPGAAALRADVTALAKPRCGSCHQSSRATAKPRALAVFDLDRDGWADGLDARQLDAFVGRIKGQVDPMELARIRSFVAGAKPARHAPP